MNKILKEHYAKISRMGAAAISKKFKLKTKAQKKAYYSAVRAGKKMSAMTVDNFQKGQISK